MIKIERAGVGPFYTNLYLLTVPAESGGNAGLCAIVDAPTGTAQFLRPILEKRKLRLDAILLTHGHWDHNSGVPALLDAIRETQPLSPKIFAHAADRPCHEHPENFRAWYEAAVPGLGDEDFRPVPVSHWLSDGETFPLLGARWTAFHVPGHCPGSLVYYCEKEKIAFVGDAIFAGSVGRTDLPGGDFPMLERAIREKIYTLPDDVVLYPGHGPKSDVFTEKSSNPFVRP